MGLDLRIDLARIKCQEDSTGGWLDGVSAIVGSRAGDRMAQRRLPVLRAQPEMAEPKKKLMRRVVEEVDPDAEFLAKAAELLAMDYSCRKCPFVSLAGDNFFGHLETDFHIRANCQLQGGGKISAAQRNVHTFHKLFFMRGISQLTDEHGDTHEEASCLTLLSGHE